MNICTCREGPNWSDNGLCCMRCNAWLPPHQHKTPANQLEILIRAIDQLCYRSGAHISADGTVTFPTDRERCGSNLELRATRARYDVVPMTEPITTTEQLALRAPSLLAYVVRVEPSDTPGRWLVGMSLHRGGPEHFQLTVSGVEQPYRLGQQVAAGHHHHFLTPH